MTFEHPYMLLFVWSAAFLFLLALWGGGRRKRILKGYAEGQGYDRLAGQAPAGRRYAKAGLLSVSLVFMLVALAGPRYGYRWEAVEEKGVDIVVALDCSRSMLTEDLTPNRLVRAKREIIDLLNMLTGDRVGLVAFSGTAFIQCPLTQDYSGFGIFLDALSPDFLPVGGTDLSAAIDTAASAFNRNDPSDKAILIITDGEDTTGGNPLEAAKRAAETGIKIFCIGVGGSQGAPVPGTGEGFTKDREGNIVISRLDEGALKQIALATDGAYVRSVAGDMDLDVIYRDKIRNTMEAKTLHTGRRQIWENRFQWFVALALVCLIVELLIPAKKTFAATFVFGLLLMNGTAAHAAGVYTDVKQGRTAYENGEYEKALTHFIDAQLKDPDNPMLYYNIGDAYYRTRNYEEAARNYSRALSLATKGETAGSESRRKSRGLKQNVLYNLGNTAFRQNNFDAAIDYYEKTLAVDPDDRQARDNLQAARKAKELRQQQDQSHQSRKDQQKDKEKNQDQQHQNGGDKNQAQNAAPDEKSQQSPQQKPQQQSPDDRQEDQKGSQTQQGKQDQGDKQQAGQQDGQNQQAQQQQGQAGQQGLANDNNAEQQQAAGNTRAAM
ncbi:MAG: vWA domain-containing protein, partial [Thermodesulfobacteriota bacterium]